jgi:hypothetical protein
LEAVSKLHDKDVAANYNGVFLVDALEKKYPAASKDFIWQWFFPQKTLTHVPGTNERKRYHLHESQLQEALKESVRLSKLTKRVKHIRFVTVLPLTFYRQIMIFAQSRQCWGTLTLEPR